MTATRNIDEWNGVRIARGAGVDLAIEIGEGHSGRMIEIPIHVRRGARDGPTVFLTAALHGDELNGTGAIRTLIRDASFQLDAGALICVPVLNVLAFDRHSRYLPDRRDLNRCFPGSATGSLASRIARIIFDEIISRSDYGIDLHTAAVRRTNYPTVRADLSNPDVRRLAEAFGGELIIDGRGPKGAFRRAACEAGCPTIVMEGGEIWKVEPTIVDRAVAGIRGLLVELGMIEGPRRRPARPVVVSTTTWVRADRGGFLEFHVAPGEIVDSGDPLATHTDLLGRGHHVLNAPFAGVVIGMTTLPSVSFGEPVCHLGKLGKDRERLIRLRDQLAAEGLHGRLLGDLATNLRLVAPPDAPDA